MCIRDRWCVFIGLVDLKFYRFLKRKVKIHFNWFLNLPLLLTFFVNFSWALMIKDLFTYEACLESSETKLFVTKLQHCETKNLTANSWNVLYIHKRLNVVINTKIDCVEILLNVCFVLRHTNCSKTTQQVGDLYRNCRSSWHAGAQDPVSQRVW